MSINRGAKRILENRLSSTPIGLTNIVPAQNSMQLVKPVLLCQAAQTNKAIFDSATRFMFFRGIHILLAVLMLFLHISFERRKYFNTEKMTNL